MRFGRRYTTQLVVLSAFSFILAATVFSLGYVLAGNRVDDEKASSVARDRMNPASVSDYPKGQVLDTELIDPIPHGSLLVFPPGKLPSYDRPRKTPDGRIFEEGLITSDQFSNWPLRPDALLDTYHVSDASFLEVVLPDGSRYYAEFGFQLLSDGYPIEVSWFIQPFSDTGTPFPIPAWGPDSNLITTLGDIAGRKSVFVHRREGVDSPELQEVYVSDGPRLLVVSSYRDDFSTLMEAAAVLAGSLPLEAIPGGSR